MSGVMIQQTFNPPLTDHLTPIWYVPLKVPNEWFTDVLEIMRLDTVKLFGIPRNRNEIIHLPIIGQKKAL